MGFYTYYWFAGTWLGSPYQVPRYCNIYSAIHMGDGDDMMDDKWFCFFFAFLKENISY